MFRLNRSRSIQSKLWRSYSTGSGTSKTKDDLRESVMKWMNSIVIDQKLCPFAAPVRQAPKLRVKISNTKSHDDIIRDIEHEVKILVGNRMHRQDSQQHETTLVVIDDPSLKSFRDLVRLSWRVQEEAINNHGYTKNVQLVLFHPEAKHDTYTEQVEEDAADYTIRSPYPIIHLLREVDVMKAVSSGYKDLEGLPSRNKARLRRQGIDTCVKRLKACIKTKS